MRICDGCGGNEVEDESDESLFWLEMIEEAKLLPAGRLDDLKKRSQWKTLPCTIAKVLPLGSMIVLLFALQR